MALLGAGVEALVLAGEVESPVLLQVAVGDDGAEGEDGFGSVQAAGYGYGMGCFAAVRTRAAA